MDILFSIFIFFLLKSEVASAPALSQLTVIRVGPCWDRKPTEVVTVSEMSLHKVSRGVALSGPVWIHKDVNNGWTIKSTMQKCHDIRNLDTCDFYKAAVVIRDGCEDPADENMSAFGVFAKYVTPRLSCPIKAGNYTIDMFPFFTTSSVLITAEAKISTSVFGYTYRLEGFNEEDDRLFCVDSSLRMVYTRKHDWIGAQKFEDKVPLTEDATSAPALNTLPDIVDDEDIEDTYDGADKTDKKNHKKHATDSSTVKTDGSYKESGGSKIKGKFDEVDDSNETEGIQNDTGETNNNKSVSPIIRGKSNENNEKGSAMDDTKDGDVEADHSGDITGRDDQKDDANGTEHKPGKTKGNGGWLVDLSTSTKKKDQAIEINEKNNKMDETKHYDPTFNNQGEIKGKDVREADANESKGEQYKTGDKSGQTKDKDGHTEDKEDENSENTSVETESAENATEPQPGKKADKYKDEKGEKEKNSKNIYEKLINRPFLQYSHEPTKELTRQLHKPTIDKHQEFPTYWVNKVTYYI